MVRSLLPAVVAIDDCSTKLFFQAWTAMLSNWSPSPCGNTGRVAGIGRDGQSNPANPRCVTSWTERRGQCREGWNDRHRNASSFAGPPNTGCGPGLALRTGTGSHGNQYGRLLLRARGLAARRVAGRALRVGVARRSAGDRRASVARAMPVCAGYGSPCRRGDLAVLHGHDLLGSRNVFPAGATARRRGSGGRRCTCGRHRSGSSHRFPASGTQSHFDRTGPCKGRRGSSGCQCMAVQW